MISRQFNRLVVIYLFIMRTMVLTNQNLLVMWLETCHLNLKLLNFLIVKNQRVVLELDLN